MKRCKWASLVALIALGLSSCEKQPAVDEKDLYGYWHCQETNEYMRFMHDSTEMKDGYFLGYEWDADENKEANVREVSYHGNGWFEWTLKNSSLTFFRLSDIGSAESSQTYVISLSSSTLVMKKDSKAKQYTKTNQPQ